MHPSKVSLDDDKATRVIRNLSQCVDVLVEVGRQHLERKLNTKLLAWPANLIGTRVLLLEANRSSN